MQTVPLWVDRSYPTFPATVCGMYAMYELDCAHMHERYKVHGPDHGGSGNWQQM